MPYIGNNPVSPEVNISAQSVDIFTDVDTVSNAPQIGQVLKWNGTNWVPDDDTGTGGGATSSDLQGVTDNGSVTSNVISASGFKLNADQLSTVAGVEGDIKKIGGLPYYHDGTTWRRFYLFDNPTDQSAVDINWDDVQVRMDFEDDSHLWSVDPFVTNYVNRKQPRSSNINNICRVNSPVKFGSSSLKLNAQSTADNLEWEVYVTDPTYNIHNEILDQTSLRHYWKPGKRGGCTDWSGDWTLEMWIYFPANSLTNNQHQGLFYVTDGPTSLFGASIFVDQFGNRTFLWVNDVATTSYSVGLGSAAAVTDETWHHIVLCHTAADSRVNVYRQGAWLGSFIDSNIPTGTGLSNETRFGLAPYSGGWVFSNYFIDDLRITQAARYQYQIGYTLPTSAYPISAPAPSSVDLNWNEVQVRNTFDVNANDESQNSYTGSLYSSTVISSSSVKYGSSSLLVGETFVGTTTGLTYPSNSDFSFLEGDWTFETWVNFISLAPYNNGAVYSPIFSFGSTSAGGTGNIEFGIQNPSSSNSYYNFYWRDDASGIYTAYNLTSLSSDRLYTSDLVGKWNHIALTKESTNSELQLYVNGYNLGPALSRPGIILNSAGVFSLGGRNYSSVTGEAYSWAYYDDLRITDIVRYTENFTPPTGPLGTTGTVVVPVDEALSGEGIVALGNPPLWTGTSGWTVTRLSQGNYRVDFPGAYASSTDYRVYTQFMDGPSEPVNVRVTRWTDYVDLAITKVSDGSHIDSGYVSLKISN